MTTSGSRISAFIACVALTGAGLVAAASPAQASTLYVWTGSGDGNAWSDPDNWSPTGVPDNTTESARILEGQVFIDTTYDINAVTLSGTGAIIDDGSGSLTATSFEMQGGTLSAPVTASSFAFTGPDDKEVTSSGSINATLVRGGNQGEVSVRGGKVELNTDGTTESGGKSIKAKTSLTISARLDGRGANRATIEIEDSGCNPETATFVCGVIVEAPTDPYGAAIEGVTLVSSNITFTGSTTLALREGYWKPRPGIRIRSVNDSTGVVETGGAYPPGEPGTPDEEVTLPASLTLDGASWNHVSGTVAGNGAISAGASSARIAWRGGVISGRLAVKARVFFSFEGTADDPLELDAPSRGGANITLEGGGQMAAGTSLVLDEASTLVNKGSAEAPFIQRPDSIITSVTSSSSVSKVVNEGHWIVDSDTIPAPTSVSTRAESPGQAVIEYVPFTSTGSLAIEAGGALKLDGGRANSITGKTTVNVRSATEFGAIAVGADSTLKLAGSLGVNATGAGLESGDEMLVVESLVEEGDAGSITGGFSPITSTGLDPGLGLSGELIDSGYVLGVGAPEELALTGKALARIKIKRPLSIAYGVWNKSNVEVTPQLNLPIIKGAKITVPEELSCSQVGTTYACELATLPPGERLEITVSYIFGKPGKQTITTTVTSAGYNPNPAGATSTLKVSVTR